MNIQRVSYHTHTTISDGKLKPEELIKLAIKKKFKVLAITDHYTRPKGISLDDWGSNFYSDKDYEELLKLKEKYKNKIDLLIGTEFDWLPTKKEWLKDNVKKRDYDIKIISVHMLYIKGEYYLFNANKELFSEILDLLGNNIKKLVKLYYKNLRKAIKTRLFDVVGHFDLIKIFNEDSRYFSDKDSWYKREVVKTLRLMRKFNLKLDVNLAGFNHPVKEQYPSKWIIDIAKSMKINLLIGTDAHDKKELEYDLTTAQRLIE